MIKKLVEDISVDAGLILISDKDYYKKYNGSEEFKDRLSKKLLVPPGKYKVYWDIKETWNGDIEGTGVLNVTSGEVIISDPCYLIRDSEWDRALQETDFFKNEPEGTVVLDSMGGDGSYDVFIELTEVNF